MELFEGLNEEQRLAVTSTEGYVRVIAGAGSGKTRALSHRFAYLVNEIGVPPANILCVTFTNKSAGEMRTRIRALTGDNGTGYICTFHSFCVSVLQEESYAVQYPKNFLVIDNGDINAMLKTIYEERGLTLRDMTFQAARDMIELLKTVKRPTYYEDMIALSFEELKQKYDSAKHKEDIIFYGYLYQQKKCFALDYNDLIKFTLHIFTENPDIKRKWQERLAYIMVDEFQDIDDLQYRLMQSLIGYHNNLFIVGDPDQTIYTWRGADVRFLLGFEREYPNVKTIMMMKNYRSTPEILATANFLIDKNANRIKKELLPTLPSGPRVRYSHHKTAEEEARSILKKVRALEKEGAPLSDMAILYRAHYVTRTLEEVFLKEGLPYVIYSGVQFFDRAEIKDALSYLRFIAYQDDLSFARIINVPRRNVGERRLKLLREYAEHKGCSLYQALLENAEREEFKGAKVTGFTRLVERFSGRCRDMPVSELLTALLQESGYEALLRTEGSQERLNNLAELKQSIYEYETTSGEESALEHYLARVALFSNLDAAEQKNAVKMMTVHSAKGLEFPYVFLAALEEGVFPSKKTATLEGMEEERRLAFVAMTRAEKGLFLSDSEGRNLDGSFRCPSRFIFEIDPALLQFETELPDGLVREAKWRINDSEARLFAHSGALPFGIGDRVVHSVMGAGEVVDIDQNAAAYVIQFDILPTERKISFKVKLQKE